MENSQVYEQLPARAQPSGVAFASARRLPQRTMPVALALAAIGTEKKS